MLSTHSNSLFQITSKLQNLKAQYKNRKTSSETVVSDAVLKVHNMFKKNEWREITALNLNEIILYSILASITCKSNFGIGIEIT